MVNAWWERLDFSVPDSLRNLSWQVDFDTADPDLSGRPIDPSATVALTPRSLMLLRGTTSARRPLKAFRRDATGVSSSQSISAASPRSRTCEPPVLLNPSHAPGACPPPSSSRHAV